jgi:hypothetical protein
MMEMHLEETHTSLTNLLLRHCAGKVSIANASSTWLADCGR